MKCIDTARPTYVLAELVPTAKLILRLRDRFPRARLVGGKFEVDGGREAALRAAWQQLAEAGTGLCVANGPAYGPGFGLISREGEIRVESAEGLYVELGRVIRPSNLG